MKKILSSIFTLCLIVPCMFILNACKDEQNKEYNITFTIKDSQPVTYNNKQIQSLYRMKEYEKEGYTFNGWYADENLTNKIPDIVAYVNNNSNKNLSVYGELIINVYTITFETYGGTEIQSKAYEYNTLLTKPQDPVKESYCFEGWYTDKEFTQEYYFYKMPAENITLYAKFTPYFEVNSQGYIFSINPEYLAQGAITIPEIYNGVDIVGLHNELFANNSTVTSINLSKNLKTIGDYVFSNCSKLASITIPDNVTEIGAGAFFVSTNLKHVTLGNGINTIPENCFAGCSSLTTLELGPNINAIEYGAFNDSGIENINLQNVRTIGAYAFSNCDNLKTIEIPNSVTEIGGNLFYYCSNLKKVVVGEGLQTIADRVFCRCIMLTDVVLGSNVKEVDEYAFAYCSSLEYLSLPNNIETIGQYAFYQCVALQEIILPESLQAITFSMLEGCKNLKYCNIPSRVAMIEQRAFYGCSSINHFFIPSRVAIIKVRYNARNDYNYSPFYGTNADIYLEADSAQLMFDKYWNYNSKSASNTHYSCGYTEYENGLYLGEKLNNGSYNKHELIDVIDTSVTEFTIYEYCYTIGRYAFENVNNLSCLDIPYSVSLYKNRQAFKNFTNLKTVFLNNEYITNDLTEETSRGCVIMHATTVYIKSGLEVENSTYLLENFTKQETSDKTGYDMYVKNAD